jgi:hypothetical protein
MDNKPFRPQIVDPSKHYLHDQYGITDERRLDLSARMDRIFTHPGTQVITVASVIDQIADFCDTPGEFAYCVHTNAAWLQQKGMLL